MVPDCLHGWRWIQTLESSRCVYDTTLRLDKASPHPRYERARVSGRHTPSEQRGVSTRVAGQPYRVGGLLWPYLGSTASVHLFLPVRWPLACTVSPQQSGPSGAPPEPLAMFMRPMAPDGPKVSPRRPRWDTRGPQSRETDPKPPVTNTCEAQPACYDQRHADGTQRTTFVGRIPPSGCNTS